MPYWCQNNQPKTFFYSGHLSVEFCFFPKKKYPHKKLVDATERCSLSRKRRHEKTCASCKRLHFEFSSFKNSHSFLSFILPSLSSSVIFSFNETALAISGTIDISSHDRMCEGEKSMQIQPIFASLWARYETTKSEQHSTALTMVKPGQLRSAEAEQYTTTDAAVVFILFGRVPSDL